MTQKYVFILDCATDSVIIIELTEDEIKELETNYSCDYEEFVSTLEDKYNFRISEVSWMITDNLNVQIYRKGKKFLNINHFIQ